MPFSDTVDPDWVGYESAGEMDPPVVPVLLAGKEETSPLPPAHTTYHGILTLGSPPM